VAVEHVDQEGSAGKGISKEEGANHLVPSSTSAVGQVWIVVLEHANLVCLCVVVLTRAIVHHHHALWLKLCGRHRQSVPGDINDRMLRRFLF